MSDTATSELMQVAAAFGKAADSIASGLKEIKADLKHSQTMRRLLLLAIALDLCVTVATALIITVTLNSNTTVTVIRDCTQTTGKCYVRNAKASAVLIGQLEKAQAAAALCATQHPKATFTELQSCITTTLHSS